MKKFKRKVLAMLMTNNSGSSLRQQLFDSAPFCSELLYTAIPQRAASGTTATFTRATTSTWPNNDGYMVTGVAGEIGFVGARRVRNLLTYSEDLSNAIWTKNSASITGTTQIVEAAANAQHYILQAANFTSGKVYILQGKVKSNGRRYCVLNLSISAFPAATSVFFDLQLGTLTSTGAGAASGTISSADSNGFYTITIKATANATASANAALYLSSAQDSTAAYLGDGASGIYAKDFQLEDVTAQTTQTAGEYVSVGALDYRTDADPLYLSLAGGASAYASTPDSAANSITGDIDIRCKVSMADWTPSVYSALVSKWTAGGLSYLLAFNNTGGALILQTSADSGALSSAATGFVDGTTHWVRATKNVTTGKVNFYTSEDGSTWTQLGTEQTVTAGAITDAGNSEVTIGGGSVAAEAVGNFYQAQVYNGINGTLAVDFNPHRDATTPTGTITSSTTGEVWTINGASSVIRSDYYHGSCVDGVKCFPTDLSGNPIPSTTMLGYQAQGARTNLCLQSNAFTTTWVNSPALSTLSQNVIGPDGAVSAWTCADTDAANTSRLYQSITLTAAAYTASLFVKKTSGATSFPVIALVTGTVYGLATLDTNNGVATAWTANGYGTTLSGVSARCSSFNSDFWRFELTATGTAAAYTYQLYPAGTTNATQSTGIIDAAVTGSAVIYGAQVELGSFASSPIATTTAAVTRNADVLTYSGGDIPNLKTLCATFRRESGVESVGWAVALSDGTISNYESISAASATEARFLGVTGGVTQWDVIPSYTAGTTSKAAFSAATNDIKMAKDGVAQTQDTSATVPTVTQLNVGHVAGSFQFSGNVGGIYGWTRNLSQSELNAITS